jgi:hypothetical protein
VKIPKPTEAAAWSARDAAPWIDQALTHAAALPPNVPKKRVRNQPS